MRVGILVAALTLVGVAGCGDKVSQSSQNESLLSSTTGASPAVAPVPDSPPLPLPTAEDWRAALESVMPTPSNPAEIDDEKDGVTRYASCLERKDKTCELGGRVQRDAFRKLRIVETVSGSYVINDAITHLNTYVSLPDNKLPLLFLTAYYRDQEWLFLRKVSVLVDGELLLEQDIGHSDAKRNTYRGKVEERVHFIPDDAQLAALRKVPQAKTVLVRFTGDKGYISLPSKQVEGFKAALSEALAIHDKLMGALKGKTPP